MAATPDDQAAFLTLGVVAQMLRVREYHIHRLCTKEIIPFTRVGRLRLFRRADLDAIRAQCEQAGYLQARELAHA